MEGRIGMRPFTQVKVRKKSKQSKAKQAGHDEAKPRKCPHVFTALQQPQVLQPSKTSNGARLCLLCYELSLYCVGNSATARQGSEKTRRQTDRKGQLLIASDCCLPVAAPMCPCLLCPFYLSLLRHTVLIVLVVAPFVLSCGTFVLKHATPLLSQQAPKAAISMV
jgi:hypothetical protein